MRQDAYTVYEIPGMLSIANNVLFYVECLFVMRVDNPRIHLHFILAISTLGLCNGKYIASNVAFGKCVQGVSLFFEVGEQNDTDKKCVFE